MTVHSFPRGFFTSLTFNSSDTLVTAVNWCEDNAQAAPVGSRGRAIWAARRDLVIKVVEERGAFVAKLDAHSGYVVLTKDEYTQLVNSSSRIAAGQR